MFLHPGARRRAGHAPGGGWPRPLCPRETRPARPAPLPPSCPRAAMARGGREGRRGAGERPRGRGAATAAGDAPGSAARAAGGARGGPGAALGARGGPALLLGTPGSSAALLSVWRETRKEDEGEGSQPLRSLRSVLRPSRRACISVSASHSPPRQHRSRGGRTGASGETLRKRETARQQQDLTDPASAEKKKTGPTSSLPLRP